MALLVTALAGGAIYVLVPGPTFLALLSIGAVQGRWAAARFVAGNLAGDMLWNALALIALVGARRVGPELFDMLGLACGLYLSHLGLRALIERQPSDSGLSASRPLLRGLVFGLTNPKGYPVALATFTALLAGSSKHFLGFDAVPALLAAVWCGIVLADVVLVLAAGARPTRRFYGRHGRFVSRLVGILFISFGVHSLLTASGDIRLRLSRD